LLVLDEPTLGLDILLPTSSFSIPCSTITFDRSRTILRDDDTSRRGAERVDGCAVHRPGRIVFECSMEEMESRYLELTVESGKCRAARTLKPMTSGKVFGRSVSAL
jgi:hypothetical protein